MRLMDKLRNKRSPIQPPIDALYRRIMPLSFRPLVEVANVPFALTRDARTPHRAIIVACSENNRPQLSCVVAVKDRY